MSGGKRAEVFGVDVGRRGRERENYLRLTSGKDKMNW